MTDDASVKSQDFSAIFRAARDPQQRGNKLRKSGVARYEKSAPIYDGNYKGGAHSRLKNCDHVVSGSISQRYVRARESRCVNRRETYRAPIIRVRRIRYRYRTISIRFFFSTRKILDGKRGKWDLENCARMKKLGIFAAELPLHSRASGVIKMCGLAKIRGEKARTALRVNYDAEQI